MSREALYTPEELFVKITEAGRVGQWQRPVDKKRFQDFLFSLSFLYDFATIGRVAGDSDNFVYFLNRTSGSVTKTSCQEAVSSRFAVRLLHFQSWGSRMSGATTKTILLFFFMLQTTWAMHMKPSLEKAQCDR